jgi:hypothetical protein
VPCCPYQPPIHPANQGPAYLSDESTDRQSTSRGNNFHSVEDRYLRPGPLQDRATPDSWSAPRGVDALFCRDSPVQLSRISWRTTVAHQSTEDTNPAALFAELGSYGSRRAFGAQARLRAALGRRPRRALTGRSRDPRETTRHNPTSSMADPRLAPSPWPLDCPATTTHVKSAYGVRKRIEQARLLTCAALALVWQLSGGRGRCGCLTPARRAAFAATRACPTRAPQVASVVGRPWRLGGQAG